MPVTVDLLISNASQLLTMENGLGLIEDGAVAVHKGRIAAVGKTADIEQQYVGKQGLDASGKTLTPGLIDCHTHLLFAGSREHEYVSRLQGAGYLEILRQGGGILSTVRQVRGASKEQLIEHGKRWLQEFLLHGVTCLEIKSGYGLDYVNERKLLEAIVALRDHTSQRLIATFLGAHAFPPEARENPDQYLDEILNRMLPDFTSLAEHCDIYLEQGAFSYDQADAILKRAQSLGYELKMHSNQMHSLGGMALAKKYALLSVEHLDHMSEQEIELLAQSGSVAVLLPGASFFLRESQWAPARRLIEHGIPIALSTDFNPGTSPCANLHFIMNLAAQRLDMLPEEVWPAVTLNAAKALGRDTELGSLREGKHADLTLWTMPNHLYPFYHFGKNFVAQVWINGLPQLPE